jgi:dipeptidyl aminopeptidase/acylaminoacyl peptidase
VEAPEVSGRIAYIHQGDIWVMRTDGTRRERMTTSGDCSQPTWSPNGRSIAYVRAFSGRKHIWVLDLAQRSAQRITPKGGNYECPRWSPDGTWLAYLVWDEAQSAQIASGSLVKLSINGGKQLALISHMIAGGELAWSPDGQKILFSEGGENQRLIMADAVNGGRLGSPVYKHPMTSTSSAFKGLHWVEGGATALFVETPMDLTHVDSYAVKRLDLSTGKARELYADRSAPEILTMCCNGSGRDIWLGTPYPRYSQIRGIFHLVGRRLERVSGEGGDPSYIGSLD